MQQRTLDNIAPRGKYLLVQRDPADEKVGNIILAGSAVKPKTTGTVVRVGDKVEALTEGDRIIFGQWVQQEVEIEKETYLIMRDEDALVKL